MDFTIMLNYSKQKTMKYKVELEFDIDDSKSYPSIYMFGYYLERNMNALCNHIFEDWNDDDTPKNLGFVPDEIMTYKVINIKELKDK